MKIFESDTNPTPSGGDFGFLDAGPSVRLRYAYWRGRLGVTVVLLQGRAECVEKYFETIGELVSLGYGVLTFDFRGQGLSTRASRWGYIDGFDEYESDLHAALTLLSDSSDRLIFVCHSMGSLVGLYALPRLSPRPDGIIFLSPLFGFHTLRDFPTRHLLSVARFLGLGGLRLGSNFILRRFEGNDLTSDSDRFARNTELLRLCPELSTGGLTVSWLWSVFDALGYSLQPNHFRQLSDVPCLIISGLSDSVISTQRIEYVSSSLSSCNFLGIPDARHELLQERDAYRDITMNAIRDFLESATP